MPFGMLNRLPQLIGRANALTFADQIAWSLSNVILTFVVAAALGVEACGQFSLILACYLIAWVIGQSAVGEPLVILSGGRASTQRLNEAFGFAFVIGLLLVPVGIGIAFGTSSWGMLWMSLSLPGLLLQD